MRGLPTIRAAASVSEGDTMYRTDAAADEQPFRRLLDAIEDGVLVLESDGRVSFANAAIVARSGWTERHLMARPLDRTLGLDPAAAWNEPQAIELRRSDGVRMRMLMRVTRSEGRSIVLLTDPRHLRGWDDESRRDQKMEAIGRLAGGIAHDFNNLLTAMFGYAEVIAARLPREHEVAPTVESLQQCIEDAGALTRALMQYARRGTPPSQHVDLRMLVREVGALLEHTVPPRVQIILEIPDEDVVVSGDPTQLKQVVMNLAMNARDAMPDGGSLHLVVASTSDAPTRARMTVRDSGVGMSDEVLRRAFEPFFTTRVREYGTGLGLAIVDGIVRDHGGEITLRSEPGRGTTAEVLLPSAECVESEDVSHAQDLQLRVAVIESATAVRGVLVTMLEELGCSVVAGADARSVLERLGESHPALVVLDTDGLDPNAATDELRSWTARCPVIQLASVASDRMMMDRVAVLRKPFAIGDLRDAIMRVRVGEEGQHA
ncbi:MAG: ATP-binding protein [Planctomycetota bacterium]